MTHRRVGVGKASAGQSDELCELKRKTAFNWYSEPGVWPPTPAREEQHRERERPRFSPLGDTARSKRHSTSPYTPRSISRRVADAPNSA